MSSLDNFDGDEAFGGHNSDCRLLQICFCTHPIITRVEAAWLYYFLILKINDLNHLQGVVLTPTISTF